MAELWSTQYEDIAAELGLVYADLSTTDKALVARKAARAESRVSDYLNRPLTPVVSTVEDLLPLGDENHRDYRTWPQVAGKWDDRYDVVTVEAAASGEEGLYDVTFAIGLDVATDAALASIREFIISDAAERLAQDPRFTAVERAVVSVSAGGQSVTYARPEGNAAGAPVDIATLRRWKRMPAARVNTTVPFQPWPYV